MRKQRTHFDKAFKENTIKLSLDHKNVSELAQELGIAPEIIIQIKNQKITKLMVIGVQPIRQQVKFLMDNTRSMTMQLFMQHT